MKSEIFRVVGLSVWLILSAASPARAQLQSLDPNFKPAERATQQLQDLTEFTKQVSQLFTTCHSDQVSLLDRIFQSRRYTFNKQRAAVADAARDIYADPALTEADKAAQFCSVVHRMIMNYEIGGERIANCGERSYMYFCQAYASGASARICNSPTHQYTIIELADGTQWIPEGWSGQTDMYQVAAFDSNNRPCDFNKLSPDCTLWTWNKDGEWTSMGETWKIDNCGISYQVSPT